MEIKDLLPVEKVKELTDFRQTQKDSSVVLTHEQESKYQKVAEKMLNAHGKGFIHIKRAKSGAICGLICFKVSYKFRVRYPGVMEVYNNRKSFSLERFLSQMKIKFNNQNK